MFRNYEINMIDCWIRNWSHIVGGDAFPKSLRLRRFKSDRDKIRQDCSSANYASIVAESDFWYDVTLYFRDGAHNVRWLPASPPSACDVIGSLYAPQFLIHSTFILVFTLEHLPGDCNRIGGSLLSRRCSVFGPLSKAVYRPIYHSLFCWRQRWAPITMMPPIIGDRCLPSGSTRTGESRMRAHSQLKLPTYAYMYLPLL